MPSSHSESERIEFSLENRHVLFLLFALLVISLFVFLMGFMVGRRSQGLAATQQVQRSVVAANIAGQKAPQERPFADEEFAFEKGVHVNDAAKLPPTRDEGTAPRDENTVRAERFVADRAVIEATRPKLQAGQTAPFTLQIRRFKDRAAAEVLRHRIRRKGFEAVISSSPSGNFVVTVGSYSSWKDALTAKAAFESKVGVVAYAARR